MLDNDTPDPVDSLERYLRVLESMNPDSVLQERIDKLRRQNESTKSAALRPSVEGDQV